jgi:hypothetical protein
MVAVDMYTDYIKQYILQAPMLYKEFDMKFVDRTGQRFGKLVVTEQAGRNALKKVLWKCKCDCGNEAIVVAGSLITGNTESCGCVIKNFKHGGAGKGSYNSWRSMVRRCTNPKDKDYKRYGAKGIAVCSEWMDYTAFRDAMGEPVGAETLDRIDPTGNYEPRNVRWASPTVQARNVKTRKTTISGHTGVHFRVGKWYGEITVKKNKYYSKACNTIEEAAAARKELERKHWQ